MTFVDTPQSSCRLGVARVDITPPVGIYHRMWGAATHDRSTGIHRPLVATAVVFQPSEASELGAAAHPPGSPTRHVLLAVDHCLLWAREMELVLARV